MQYTILFYVYRPLTHQIESYYTLGVFRKEYFRLITK